MIDRDALIRRIARHEFPDPRIVRQTPRGPVRPASPAEEGPPTPPPVAHDEPGRPTGPTTA